MKRILKYPVAVVGVTELEVALSAWQDTPVLLEPGDSPNSINLWFETDTDETPEKAYVQVIGTGHEIDEDAVWLGSVRSGIFVWHVYGIDAPTEEKDDFGL